ncbi:MAG: response regulator [Deltaproteobacteria bacterium]|nr:response regulator [Deltaproteobacteria bacterium]
MAQNQSLPKILAADDDPEILKMVEAALKPVGAELFTAEDGEKALETFLVEKPQLVILDVMMPGLTGWEVAKYIRERDEYKDVRLLMLTGIGETLNAATSPLIGADDHLDKPFAFNVLAARVRKLLDMESA